MEVIIYENIYSNDRVGGQRKGRKTSENRVAIIERKDNKSMNSLITLYNTTFVYKLKLLFLYLLDKQWV